MTLGAAASNCSTCSCVLSPARRCRGMRESGIGVKRLLQRQERMGS